MLRNEDGDLGIAAERRARGMETRTGAETRGWTMTRGVPGHIRVTVGRRSTGDVIATVAGDGLPMRREHARERKQGRRAVRQIPDGADRRAVHPAEAGT